MLGKDGDLSFMSERVKVGTNKKQILTEDVDKLNESSTETMNAFDISFNKKSEDKAVRILTNDDSNENSKTHSSGQEIAPPTEDIR